MIPSFASVQLFRATSSSPTVQANINVSQPTKVKSITINPRLDELTLIVSVKKCYTRIKIGSYLNCVGHLFTNANLSAAAK